MSSYLIVPGAVALPESTKARLKEQVKALDLAIDKIFTRFEYYVYSEEPLSVEQQEAVAELLTLDTQVAETQVAKVTSSCVLFRAWALSPLGHLKPLISLVTAV